MELIITIIGIGIALVMNVVAIAILVDFLKEQRYETAEDTFYQLKPVSAEIAEVAEKVMTKLRKMERQMKKNRTDIMNEIYTTQAMIRDEKKKGQK